LVPRFSICLRIASLAPLPTATTMMSAPTPIYTPSMVNAERILLRPVAWAAAMRIISAKPGSHRLEARRSGRWKDAERSTSAAVDGAAGLVTPFVGDDYTVTLGHDAVSMDGDIALVRHKHDCDPLFAIERDQGFHDLVRRGLMLTIRNLDVFYGNARALGGITSRTALTCWRTAGSRFPERARSSCRTTGCGRRIWEM
jgi:hypothetical protein